MVIVEMYLLSDFCELIMYSLYFLSSVAVEVSIEISLNAWNQAVSQFLLRGSVHVRAFFQQSGRQFTTLYQPSLPSYTKPQYYLEVRV